MRLIDAERLLIGVDGNIAKMRFKAGFNPIQNQAINLVQFTRDYIAAQPTIDAVEVVRCKDCRYWAGEILGNRCKYHSGLEHIEMTHPEAFCSFGVRKGSEDGAADM